jgi:hypothetical protein
MVFNRRLRWAARILTWGGLAWAWTLAPISPGQTQPDVSEGFSARKRQLDQAISSPANRVSPKARPGTASSTSALDAEPMIQSVTPGSGLPPSIRPASPRPVAGGLIPIPPGPRSTTSQVSRGASHHDPERYWWNYFRTHDESSGQLKETVTLLSNAGKFRDVEAVLTAYLQVRNKNAEPWMYEALALAVKMNRGPDNELVRRYLNYAADMALTRTHDPNHLVSVADQMMLSGYYDRVGALLDQAIEKVPHRAEPLMMSVNLALWTKDPKRMGDAVERLLGLGWPGNDEMVRSEARQQVEALAKTLREENRDAEAQALLARLPQAEERDLYIRLSWSGEAVLDLSVTEPRGATAGFTTPRTSGGGTILKNSFHLRSSEEIYACPRAFDGAYTVQVKTIANNSTKPVTEATLEIITHEGGAAEQKQTKTIGLASPSPVVVRLTGGRRTASLTVPPLITVDWAAWSRALKQIQQQQRAANPAPTTPKPTGAALKNAPR